MQRPAAKSLFSRRRYYDFAASKRRPSTAIIHALQGGKRTLENAILSLKNSSADQRAHSLNFINIIDGSVRLPPYDLGNVRKS